jgi:hypothetical protein
LTSALGWCTSPARGVLASSFEWGFTALYVNQMLKNKLPTHHLRALSKSITRDGGWVKSRLSRCAEEVCLSVGSMKIQQVMPTYVLPTPKRNVPPIKHPLTASSYLSWLCSVSVKLFMLLSVEHPLGLLVLALAVQR